MIGRRNRENRGAQVPPILADSDGIRVTWDPGEPPDPFCERSKVPSRLIPARTSVALRSAIHQPTGIGVVFEVTRFRAALGRH